MPTVHECLKKRFAPPEWGLLFEVHNRTGYAARSADALAMNLWPSRGLALHGIEVKTHRSDWLRELKNPAKSAKIQKYCDRWWLAADKGVVDNGELPETWGLLVRKGARLICEVQAPKLEPASVTLTFLAAIFRRLAEAQAQWIPKASIAEQVTAAHAKGRETAMSNCELGEVTRAYEQLRRSLAEFENASGVEITPWAGGHIGAVVRTVLNSNVDGILNQLGYLANQTDAISKQLRQTIQRSREQKGQMTWQKTTKQ